MAQPYIGEIRMFAGNFNPNGWMFCDGQVLPISEYDTLFNLIGTTYGGDGQETFALPDLRGRVPIHQGSYAGNTYTIGQLAGTETETITAQQTPVHSHAFLASKSLGKQNSPAGALLAQGPSITAFLNDSAVANMAANAIQPVGGSQPHTNLQPYLGLNFIISLFGIYPPPS